MNRNTIGPVVTSQPKRVSQWTSSGGRDASRTQSTGDVVGHYFFGETAVALLIETARLHESNGLHVPSNHPTALLAGDLLMLPGGSIVIQNGAEFALIGDVASDWRFTREFQKLGLDANIYLYGDDHGTAAIRPPAKEKFHRACIKRPAPDVLDPYRREMSDAHHDEIMNIPEFARSRQFTPEVLKSVIVHAGEEAGAGEAGAEGFVEQKEAFGFTKDMNRIFVKANYQALPTIGDGTMSTLLRAEDGLGTHSWNRDQLETGRLNKALYISLLHSAAAMARDYGRLPIYDPRLTTFMRAGDLSPASCIRTIAAFDGVPQGLGLSHWDMVRGEVLALAPLHALTVGRSWRTNVSVYKGGGLGDVADLFMHNPGQIMSVCYISSPAPPNEVVIPGDRAAFMAGLLGAEPDGWDALSIDCLDLGRLYPYPSPFEGEIVPSGLALVAWDQAGDLDRSFVGKLARRLADGCGIRDAQGFCCYGGDFAGSLTGEGAAARIWIYLFWDLKDWEAMTKPLVGAKEILQTPGNGSRGSHTMPAVQSSQGEPETAQSITNPDSEV